MYDILCCLLVTYRCEQLKQQHTLRKQRTLHEAFDKWRKFTETERDVKQKAASNRQQWLVQMQRVREMQIRSQVIDHLQE